MKIFKQSDSIFDAVNDVIDSGLAIIDGTKTTATALADKIIFALKGYDYIEPTIGYQNVPNHGYLYFIYDLKKFSVDSMELKMKVMQADGMNKAKTKA